MGNVVEDEISSLRAESKQFRAHAKAVRWIARRERNPVRRLLWRNRMAEYVCEAQQREELAAEMRSTFAPKSNDTDKDGE